MLKIQEKINILHKLTTSRATKKEKVVINGVLRDIVDFVNVQNTGIEELVYENGLFFNEIDEIKAKFETICLLHGINDFPTYMNKNLSYLLFMYEMFKEDKKRKMPNKHETTLRKLEINYLENG